MKCEHDKSHDKLTFVTLKHLTGVLDAALQQAGIKNQAKRESICESFIFQSAYFLDNQWGEFREQRYRVGLCFQAFTQDAFTPTKAIIADYKDGEMLHEMALGISESHFTKDDSVVPSFQQVGEVYEKA
jgi:hypothetical protein